MATMDKAFILMYVQFSDLQFVVFSNQHIFLLHKFLTFQEVTSGYMHKGIKFIIILADPVNVVLASITNCLRHTLRPPEHTQKIS